MTKFTKILLGVGTAMTATITGLSGFIAGSQIIEGNQFLDTTNNSSPSLFYNDDTVAVKTYPTLPGTEYCEGNSGALLCTVTIKLTGSGGHRNSNAGSYLCSTSTCSIVSSIVLTESGADNLYGGWTMTPLTASGMQLFNNKLVKNGISITGSGAYATGGADGTTITSVSKDVPPGATIKFTWKVGNGTEDYSRTKAVAVIRFFKFYNP